MWIEMYNTDISPYRQLLYSSILIISISSVRLSTPSTKFNIVIKTPNKTLSSATTVYKSVHIKYTLPNDNDQWTIVGFEPQIQVHKKVIEQLTVHLCSSPIYNSIWYDDKTICNNAQSILIYDWTPYSSLSPFHLPDDCGFEFNKSKSIILTVIYKTERRIHKEQSGIILYITTQLSKFRMGTMYVGNKQSGTHFSCRSSDSARVLYAIKKLNIYPNDAWWRIYTIRIRHLGRKLVESVFDSKILSNINRTNIEIISSDYFFMHGNYLLIECENKSQPNCHFLIYYIYKLNSIKNDNICQNDDFPDLFKLIPSREIPNINQLITNTSNTDGSTSIFSIILILLFTAWISTIIGCVIMRRIRGLVNFRTEASFSLSSHKSKYLAYGGRVANDNQRTGDADHIMQIDAEHTGL